MDALIIVAIAVLVVILGFYFLGVGKTRQTQQRPKKNSGAYSKRSRRKR
jgi:uncharacterized membrane protein